MPGRKKANAADADSEDDTDDDEQDEEDQAAEQAAEQAAADSGSSSEESDDDDDDDADVGDMVKAAAAAMKAALKQATVASTMKQLPKMDSQLKLLAKNQPSSVEEICGDAVDHLDKVAGTNAGKRRGAGHKRRGDAGSGWYNMPEGKMTSEIKQDLKIIQMRNYLDPKKHMRTSDWKKALPKHFQIGTVCDSKTEFYSGRVHKKNRQERITDTVLDDSKAKAYMKRSFSRIQEKTMSGRQRHMAAKRAKRQKKWMRT